MSDSDSLEIWAPGKHAHLDFSEQNFSMHNCKPSKTGTVNAPSEAQAVDSTTKKTL